MLAPRRRPLRPVVLVLALLTLVVVGVVAIESSGPTERERRTEILAYLDKVRPLIERSTSTGRDIDKIRSDAVTLGRDGLDRQLTRAAADADGVVTEARAVRPPAVADLAQNILLGAFAGRASAIHSLQPAILASLSADAEKVGAVQALVEVGRDLEAMDGAYRIFTRNLPPEAQATLPKSEWITDSNVWSPSVLGAFVAGLRNNQQLAPVHDVAVLVAAPNPAPVGRDGPLLILPDVKQVDVQIVVANKGNTTERAIEVVATLQPLDGAKPSMKREIVDLDPGQDKAFELKGIATPGIDRPFAISVKIGPVPGDDNPTDDEIPRQYVMR
jgi:hypothetical protein